ncbi:DUF4401 domain-containing protein [Ancylobacter terrae]|uniref:DUF4401 domain-containing protein n=1 Tax=Ancylobacter sp. sgz301288 TaxID=3342077 RepID=UPI00385E9464
MTAATRPGIDAATLLAAWRAAGEVPAEREAVLAEAIRTDAAQERPPLHLRLLSALGTFLATLFFLAFLGISGLISFDSGNGLLVWGIIFLALGMGLSLALNAQPAGLARDMLAQTGFTALALGKVMTVGGIMTLAGADRPFTLPAAILAVTVLTYPVSASSLDRLLSPYAVAVALIAEILLRDSLIGDPTAALTLLYAAATALAGLLLLPHRAPVALRPVGLAALATMGTIVALIAAGREVGLGASDVPVDPRPIAAILTLSLIGLVAWVAGGVAALARPPLMAAVAGIVLLGVIGAPGIGYALALLILGHALHDTPLRVLGIIALPAFLVLWYYGRDMDFLAKSAALVGSGLLLLAARAVIALAGWDREAAP